MLRLLARLKPNVPIQTDTTLQTGANALLSKLCDFDQTVGYPMLRILPLK